jgi:hypothetical protein
LCERLCSCLGEFGRMGSRQYNLISFG